MTRELNGLVVHVLAKSGKKWMWVQTPPEGSPVSFHDWFDMIRAFGICETEKYGGNPANPKHWERWTRMGRDFLDDCFELPLTYEDLRQKYGLPR